jgi:YmgG-like glycine-zipper protein
MYRNRVLRPLLVLLLMFSFALAVPVSGTQHRRRYHNPEAGKKKAAKRIGIGTAIGAGAGALIGGRKGALIGAGVGAGGGTAYHYHKKHQWRHRHRRY